VPIKVYDETIRVLKSAVQKARPGRDEELQALKRLDDQARRLERTATGPTLETQLENERNASPSLDGRSVFGREANLSARRAREDHRGRPEARSLRAVAKVISRGRSWERARFP
jgi:hypothetical protein